MPVVAGRLLLTSSDSRFVEFKKLFPSYYFPKRKSSAHHVDFSRFLLKWNLSVTLIVFIVCLRRSMFDENDS